MLVALQLAVVAGLLAWRGGGDAPQRVASTLPRAPAARTDRFDAGRAMRLVRLQLSAG